MRTKKAMLLGVILLLMVLLGACKPPETVDKPASELDVKIHVIDIDENPSDGKVPVIIQFFFDGKGVYVMDNVTITCNGVTLENLGFGCMGRVPQESVGGAYTFQHSRSGISTLVVVTAPQRPVFVPPTIEGASITRTNSLTIHYVPGSGKSVTGRASDGTHSKDNRQNDDGTHEGLNVSGFNFGPGTISLTREYVDPVNGTGFNSVEITYSTKKSINITWQ